MAPQKIKTRTDARADFLTWMYRIKSRYIMSSQGMSDAFDRIDENFAALEAIKSKPLNLSKC